MAKKLPTLVHPDGREYEPSTAQEANRLVTSEGYKTKGGESLPDAFAEGLAKLKADNDAGVVPSDSPKANDGTTPDSGESRTGTDTAKAAPAPSNKAAAAPANK